MRLDPAPLVCVACATFAAAIACRPAVIPEPPGAEPTTTPARGLDHRPAAVGGHDVMLGELCLDGAGGRPAVAPVVMRGVGWLTDHDELADALGRGRASAFEVLAIDGAHAGRFAVLGADDDPALAALGSYTGRSPCQRGGSDGAIDGACEKLRKGCGLAVAQLGAGGGFLDEDDAAPPALVLGGACLSADALAVDIDGDGTVERFRVADFLDETQAFAPEVTVVIDDRAPACAPAFALASTAPSGRRSGPDFGVLGVLDLDGDGWREVVIDQRFADKRTIAVYSAVEAAGRLSLVGEVAPWAPL